MKKLANSESVGGSKMKCGGSLDRLDTRSVYFQSSPERVQPHKNAVKYRLNCYY